jgi:PAS domain S-box-containing protein
MDTFLAGQNQILERIAAGAPLVDVLNSLVQLVEAQSTGMLCSILLLDDDGRRLRHGAASSLPESYIQAIDGLLVGPKAGSCGTAAHLGQTVIVTDILKDPLWDDFRELGARHGLRACWSRPIILRNGRVAGTFAMYYRIPRPPLRHERRLTEVATHIASIAIENRRNEQSLRESEERSRAILRAIPDSMFLLHSDYTYLECHTRSSCQIPVPSDQLIGKNIRDVLPSHLAERFVKCFENVSETGEPQLVEYDRCVNRQTQYCEARVVPTGNGKFLAVVRDITERRLAEEALRNSEEQLRQSHAKVQELARKLMTVQEEERRRISSELHDDLNQKVAALGIMISSITFQLSDANPLKNQLDMIHRYCIEIGDGIQRVSRGLHPVVLEHAGLAAALRAYVAEFSRFEKIMVQLTVPNPLEGIPLETAICLYRVAQESLSNIAQHSGAKRAEVTLSVDDQSIRLLVADSGYGFDPVSARKNAGLGLASIEERVHLLRGSFSLSTRPGGGSRLQATIPLQKVSAV